jgi:hypothetical protein
MKKLREIQKRLSSQRASTTSSMKEEQEGSNSTFEKSCLILRKIQMSRDSLRKTQKSQGDGPEMNMKSLLKQLVCSKRTGRRLKHT